MMGEPRSHGLTGGIALCGMTEEGLRLYVTLAHGSSEMLRNFDFVAIRGTNRDELRIFSLPIRTP